MNKRSYVPGGCQSPRKRWQRTSCSGLPLSEAQAPRSQPSCLAPPVPTSIAALSAHVALLSCPGALHPSRPSLRLRAPQLPGFGSPVVPAALSFSVHARCYLPRPREAVSRRPKHWCCGSFVLTSFCLFQQLKSKKPPLASSGAAGKGKPLSSQPKKAEPAAGVRRTSSSECTPRLWMRLLCSCGTGLGWDPWRDGPVAHHPSPPARREGGAGL